MRHRSKRHRNFRRLSRHRGRTKFFLWAAACFLGVATLVLLHPFSHRVSLRSATKANVQPLRKPLEGARTVASMPSPLAGFFDVIPGGIHSEKQFAEVLATNPVVAKHYANFDLRKFRFVRLRHNREAYVSYLLGDNIYWTSRKVRLFAGETLFTDGIHYARARCGNRVSEVPRQPTSPSQPPLKEISWPLRPPSLVLPKLPPLSSPSVHPLPGGTTTGSSAGGAFFPLFFPVGGGSGGSNWPPPPDAPLPTPEPPTLVLVASGLMILLLIRHFIRSSKVKDSSTQHVGRG